MQFSPSLEGRCPRTAPLDMGDLSKVIPRPLVAECIDEIGVRYLVWIEGNTVR